MDREDAKQAIDLLQAYLDGKEIEESAHPHKGCWKPCVTMLVGAIAFEYRIKPEPKEWWVYDDNINPEVIRSLNEIHRECHHRWIKVREVL